MNPWEYYQARDAFAGQESGGNPNAQSVQNARGSLQITAPLFRAYAQPGESFSRPADVNAVADRAFQDTYQRHGGDVGKVATEWFSGGPNVATSGPTPYLKDKRDANGKSVSAYVKDIMGRLNPIGTAEAAQPAPWEMNWQEAPAAPASAPSGGQPQTASATVAGPPVSAEQLPVPVPRPVDQTPAMQQASMPDAQGPSGGGVPPVPAGQATANDKFRAMFFKDIGGSPPATGTPGSFGERFGHGIGDVLSGAGRLIARGAEAVGLQPLVSSQQIAQDMAKRNAGYVAPEGMDWGRALGNVAGLAPTALIPGGPIVGGMTGGGLGGAVLAPPGEELKGAGIGALTGGLGGGALRVAGRLLEGAPQAVPGAVRALGREGVQPTVGQAAGGIASDIEERLATLPIGGRPIRAAQERATEQLNIAGYNRALAPIGESIAPGTKASGEAVAEVQRKLSDAYEAVIPYLTFQQDPGFLAKMANVDVPGLGPEATARANQIVRETIGQNAQLSGQEIKSVQSQLSSWIRRHTASADATQQGIGDYLRQAKNVFDDQIIAQNPKVADRLKAINTGWANFVRVRKAASAIGAEGNRFDAAQLQRAVHASDRSVDKGDFARGQALMQDLSQPAKQLLGRKIGTSGTAERLAITNPFALGAGLLSYPATAALYSPAGQAVARAMMTARPGQARILADLLRQSAAPAGVIGAGQALQLE